MELEEMKLVWQALGAQLESQNAMNLQLVRERGMDKLRRGLRPLLLAQVLKLILGLALAFWAAAFWATHLHSLHLLVCGLLVHAYGVLLIVVAMNNFYLIHRIDPAAPVLELQHGVAKLRSFRAHVEGPVYGVLNWFLWIPVTLMALAMAGIDLWSRGVVLWAVACSVFGMVVIAAAVWVMRRMGWRRKFEDNAVGGSVLRAETAIDEITRFDRE